MMKLNNKGFTIVELMIALTFFSFLLLMVTYGFVQVNRTYTRGITTKTIQETARTVVEDISRTLRFSDSVVLPVLDATNNHYYMTVGDFCYAWNQHNGADSSDSSRSNGVYSTTTEGIVLARGDRGNCASPVDKANVEELLDSRAVIQYLDVSNLGGSTYNITIVVSTEDASNNDLQSYGLDAQCEVQIGDQFCDVAKYETAVHTRE